MAGEWRQVPRKEPFQNFDSRRVRLLRRQGEKRRGPFHYFAIDGVAGLLIDGWRLLVAEDGELTQVQANLSCSASKGGSESVMVLMCLNRVR